MSDTPQVKPGDWIKVGSMDAVVTEARGADLVAADVQIVCDPDRPAVYKVNWNGKAWEFGHPMRGSYADHTPGAEPFVDILKKGPPLSALLS